MDGYWRRNGCQCLLLCWAMDCNGIPILLSDKNNEGTPLRIKKRYAITKTPCITPF